MCRENTERKDPNFASFVCAFSRSNQVSMGQIKHRVPRGRKSHGTGRRDLPLPVEMEKATEPAAQKSPKVRYSCDGFWTTQHPAAKAFTFEWFNVHMSMVPYFWAMLKLALSVSKQSVITIVLGTIFRAVLDVASLYAYTRFVNEVYQTAQQQLTKRLKVQFSIRIATWRSFAS